MKIHFSNITLYLKATIAAILLMFNGSINAQTSIIAQGDSILHIRPGTTTTTSILANDSLHGAPLNYNDVTISTPTGYMPPFISINTDGTITVDPESKSFSHIFRYIISDNADATNRDTAFIYLEVRNSIEAQNDTFFLNTTGTTSPSILLNDSFRNLPLDDENEYYFYSTSTLPDSVILNSDGTIEVIGAVPPGTYNFFYQLCETVWDPVEPDIDYSWSIENCTEGLVVLIFEGPLPVKLVEFDALAQNNGADLNWTTASEQLNKGFDIERSTDGNKWQSISFVPSKALNGNSSESITYHYEDKQLASGQYFYRLKQMDIDGRSEYSPVRQVVIGTNSDLLIYPNPTMDNITISHLTGSESIKLMAVDGRLISTTQAKQNTITLSLTDLPQGMYFVLICNDNNVIASKKVMKIK